MDAKFLLLSNCLSNFFASLIISDYWLKTLKDNFEKKNNRAPIANELEGIKNKYYMSPNNFHALATECHKNL